MGKRKLGGRGISKRKGSGRCGVRRNLCLDPSSHVENGRDRDHITIPTWPRGSASFSLGHQESGTHPHCMSTSINRFAYIPPLLSKDPEKGDRNQLPHSPLRASSWPLFPYLFCRWVFRPSPGTADTVCPQ